MFNVTHIDNINKKFNKLLILDAYLNHKKNSSWWYKCLCDCGNIKNVRAFQVLNGGIKSCGCGRIKHIHQVKRLKDEYVDKKINNLLILDVRFIKEKYRYEFLCKCDCGNIKWMYNYPIIKGTHKSCGCRYNKQSLRQLDIKKALDDVNIELCEPFISNHEYYDDINSTRYKRYQFRCKICNLKFISTFSPGNVIRCAYCSPLSNNSTIEGQFEQFLISENIEYKKHVRIKSFDLNMQALIEIDFLIGNIGIELHGLSTHATTNNPSWFLKSKPRLYHLNKLNSGVDNNIEILQFWNTEWIHKQKIVKSIVLNKLNKTKYKGYARKCIIKEINKTKYDDFMEVHHLQGKTIGENIRLGLYFNSKIVSVMSFGHSRYNPNFDCELFRFASYNNTNVIGAASKLFKYFKKEYSPTSIITYSDRRVFNNGKLYDILGFKYVRSSPPSYWYFKESSSDYIHKMFHRSVFQKHKLPKMLITFNENMTEIENLENNNYKRIYDCGNKVYEWRLNV